VFQIKEIHFQPFFYPKPFKNTIATTQINLFMLLNNPKTVQKQQINPKPKNFPTPNLFFQAI
jgi:hypothetical protein